MNIQQRFEALGPIYQKRFFDDKFKAFTENTFESDALVDDFEKYRFFAMAYETPVSLGLEHEYFDHLAQAGKLERYSILDIVTLVVAMNNRNYFNWLQFYGDKKPWDKFFAARAKVDKESEALSTPLIVAIFSKLEAGQKLEWNNSKTIKLGK
jgi:hypothetical protein